jgi:hypothetical protein
VVRGALVVLLTTAGAAWPPALAQPAAVVTHVDVLVFGSEPEGVAAAVTSAEAGLSTLLVTPHDRLGGLFVLGELNMLDLRTQPFNYQRGIFERWWRRVGHEEAFDVRRAEHAFEAMLEEAGVEVWRSVGALEPLLAGGAVVGVRLLDSGWEVRARQVIDASADADLAAAAGAPFDFGFERFGVQQRMADTLVLNVAGVNWPQLTREVRAKGRTYANVKNTVAWGHFGGMPAAYAPAVPGVRLRGLNLGLQDDGTVLINALLLYDLDPLDPLSRAAGRQLGLAEGEHMVAYLREHVPGFSNAHLAGAAADLYVRESRHLLAQCVLTARDVFASVVTPFDVAAGGYPLDAQTYTAFDSGFVWGTPDIYGGRLCMMVTPQVENLWVVGRSAGYDPIAFSSARVVPFGMVMAEAAAVGAVLAVELNTTATDVALRPDLVLETRARLTRRGALLPELRPRPGIGPVGHPNYQAFVTLVSRGLAVGGYENEPHLDNAFSTVGFAYLLSNVATRFFFTGSLGADIVSRAMELDALEAPLQPGVAAELLRFAACELASCPATAGWEGLSEAGLATFDEPATNLTRGQAYELAAALALLAPPLPH